MDRLRYIAMGVGLVLLARPLALQGADANDRFFGGSYDGWSRCAMTEYRDMGADAEDRFFGGSYDGWSRNIMTEYKRVLDAGTVIFIW